MLAMMVDDSDARLFGSAAWERRRRATSGARYSRPGEMRRLLENLQELAALSGTTATHEESMTGKALSVPFTNWLEVQDAMRRAKLTTGEYLAVACCVIGYTPVALRGGTREGTWLAAPMGYDEYGQEFDIAPKDAQEKADAGVAKLAALVFDRED